MGGLPEQQKSAHLRVASEVFSPCMCGNLDTNSLISPTVLAEWRSCIKEYNTWFFKY
jgi:hypothetical protein